jgi:hypothetical protein
MALRRWLSPTRTLGLFSVAHAAVETASNQLLGQQGSVWDVGPAAQIQHPSRDRTLVRFGH